MLRRVVDTGIYQHGKVSLSRADLAAGIIMPPRFASLGAEMAKARDAAQRAIEKLEPELDKLEKPWEDDVRTQSHFVARNVLHCIEKLTAVLNNGTLTENHLRLAYILGRIQEELFVRMEGERHAASAKKSRREAARVQRSRTAQKAECWKRLFDEIRPQVRDDGAAWARVAEVAEERADLPAGDAQRIPDFCGVNHRGCPYSPDWMRQVVRKFFSARP